jgi:hypothetical protein
MGIVLLVFIELIGILHLIQRSRRMCWKRSSFVAHHPKKQVSSCPSASTCS